jgi:signal transduction histidine kinase
MPANDALPREPIGVLSKQIERAKQEWESTVDSLPQLICLLDSRERIVRANRTVERWGLCPIVAVQGRRMHTLLHPMCADPACSLQARWQSAWEQLGRGTAVEFEYKDSILDRDLSVQVQPILAQRLAEADSYAVVVLEDITARKQAERALRARTEELQTRNKELDAFAHTVAHDLRDPLTLIVGFAEILKSEYTTTPAEETQKSLRTIAQNAYKMGNIIEELLLLAEVRKIDMHTNPLNMSNIVAEALDRLEHLIAKFEAQVILPKDWPTALGYAPWVEEIWANYLSNAIKYGGRPPRVELGATVQSDDTVRFWVRDNGRGLTAKEQTGLFIPFTRLDHIRVTGHGLGLSIVHRIMEKLGGQVGIESQVGLGSTFSFILPISNAPQTS